MNHPSVRVCSVCRLLAASEKEERKKTWTKITVSCFFVFSSLPVIWSSVLTIGFKWGDGAGSARGLDAL